MKILLALTALTTLSVSSNSFAKTLYADVQVTNINPTSDFIWERKNKNTPKYPVELARSGSIGCAVLSFEISDSGKSKNVEVISSLPKKKIGKYSAKMIKKWKWVTTPEISLGMSEKRTLRLDFCAGQKSIEESQAYCKKQTQLACE